MRLELTNIRLGAGRGLVDGPPRGGWPGPVLSAVRSSGAWSSGAAAAAPGPRTRSGRGRESAGGAPPGLAAGVCSNAGFAGDGPVLVLELWGTVGGEAGGRGAGGVPAAAGELRGPGARGRRRGGRVGGPGAVRRAGGLIAGSARRAVGVPRRHGGEVLARGRDRGRCAGWGGAASRAGAWTAGVSRAGRGAGRGGGAGRPARCAVPRASGSAGGPAAGSSRPGGVSAAQGGAADWGERMRVVLLV
jgi:hypothetical protein